MELCHLAGIVMARAIARGVYEATALPVRGRSKRLARPLSERALIA